MPPLSAQPSGRQSRGATGKPTSSPPTTETMKRVMRGYVLHQKTDGLGTKAFEELMQLLL